jgi:hypothetical protein
MLGVAFWSHAITHVHCSLTTLAVTACSWNRGPPASGPAPSVPPRPQPVSLTPPPCPPSATLTAVLDQEFVDVTLSQYKGKYVVLFFYPLDFT